MQTYIALIRGINVAGQKKILMNDLRLHLEELGFKNIKTYIQSGNIIFDSTVDQIAKIKLQIEQKIIEKYHFEVSVFIILPNEIRSIVKKNPFKKITTIDPKQPYVAFIDQMPNKELTQALDEAINKEEKYILDEGVIYFYCPNGYGKSKLSNNLIEKKLKVKATTRNWKTILKLIEILETP